jgi:L-alanine-DL-glutamate epimerase-like enolase superfamily enzyme
MTIRSAESWILRFPSNRAMAERTDEYFELIGVTVTDSDGETGTGWTYTADYGGGEAIKALLDVVLLHRVIGRDAVEAEGITDGLWLYTQRLGHGIASMAISAIDIAIWDLRARKMNVSIGKALGQVRDRVPCYGSGRASPSLPINELVEHSAQYIKDGHRAVKLRVGRNVEEDIDRIKAVREAIGPTARILCDANQRLDLTTALWLGKKMAEHDIYWFEEPVLTYDLAAYQRLRNELPFGIACGEHFFSRRQFVPFISGGAIDVVQPDICFVGGVTEAIRIGRLADSFGLAFAPHFMTELHIQIAAALPRATYVEFYPFLDDLLVNPLEVEEGHILVPNHPGHGVAFTDEAWKKYRAA